MIASAFANRDALGERARVEAFDLNFVQSTGELHPTYGSARIGLRRVPLTPAADPSRPLGAPLPAPLPDPLAGEPCFDFIWSAGVRREEVMDCAPRAPVEPPRCTVVEVWRLAIAKGAPATALARLHYDGAWAFTISDAARNLDLRYQLPDRCVPILERP